MKIDSKKFKEYLKDHDVDPLISDKSFIYRAWVLQFWIEDNINLFFNKVGRGFTAGLFGFSFLVLGCIGFFIYGFRDCLFNPGIPVFFNPIIHFYLGGVILMFVIYKYKQFKEYRSNKKRGFQ